MSNRTKVASACIVLLVVFGFVAFIFNNHKDSEAAQHEEKFYRQDQAMGRQFAGMHIMSIDDTIRYQEISRGVAKTHIISDEDLDWMLSLMNKPADAVGTPQEQSFGLEQRKYLILGTLETVGKSSSAQQTKVFTALMPILSGTDTLDKGEADTTLAAFKSTQAIPYLQTQLKDPNDSVRRKAKAALEALRA